MIAVIADDLTGAAELAGIALRYNLSVEVVTGLPLQSQSDVLVVATDTRSKTEADALEEVKKVTEQVHQMKPDFLFKKIDSVLRGHVLAETKIQMAVTGLPNALIVSANPYLDRIIVDGHYYFKGKPIHQSSFSSDPEFPVTSSFIPDMLSAKEGEVKVLKPDQSLEQGIVVGEVKNDEDLQAWASKNNSDYLLVGGAGFFTALLERKLKKKQVRQLKEVSLQSPYLFVCGTSFLKSQQAVKQVKENGGPVAYMPVEVVEVNDEKYMNLWCSDVRKAINQKVFALIAINIDDTNEKTIDAVFLRQQMAKGVHCMLQQATVFELFIEGGSTASAILRELDIDHLIPTNEFAPGVIRLYAPQKNLHITLKPGSYDWPADVWALITKKLMPYE